MKKIILKLFVLLSVSIVVAEAKSIQCSQTMSLEAHSNKIVYGKSNFSTTVSYNKDGIVVKDINGKIFLKANFVYQGISKGGRNVLIYKSRNKKVLLTVSEGETDRFLITRILNTNEARQLFINCY